MIRQLCRTYSINIQKTRNEKENEFLNEIKIEFIYIYLHLENSIPKNKNTEIDIFLHKMNNC